jgi:hypothetical protein
MIYPILRNIKTINGDDNMSTKDLINQIARQADVDASTVETLAKMCADRVEKWGVEVDSDSVTAAVMDSSASYRSMTITALTRMHDFSPAIAQIAANQGGFRHTINGEICG